MEAAECDHYEAKRQGENMKRFTYKNWHCSYNPKPIGIRTLDWDASHEDYDGAPDADCDDLAFCAPSAEACMTYIDEVTSWVS